MGIEMLNTIINMNVKCSTKTIINIEFKDAKIKPTKVSLKTARSGARVLSNKTNY